MVGDVSRAVARYFTSFANETFDESTHTSNSKMRRGYGNARISGIRFQDAWGASRSEFEQGERLRLAISIKRQEAINEFRFFLKLSSGITGEEVTSIDHTLTAAQVDAALKSELVVEIDTKSLRPGIYPLYFWLGDPENPSICYDCVDNATKPLLITVDGSTRGSGIFDVEACVASVKQTPARES